MAIEFERVDLIHIEEGKFVDDLNDALEAAQRALVSYVQKYGEQARKAKVSIKPVITFEVVDPVDGVVSVTTSMSTSSPSRPKQKTSALMDFDDRSVKSRAEGTGKGDPRQTTFLPRNLVAATEALLENDGEVTDDMVDEHGALRDGVDMRDAFRDPRG